jgi:hypothetical protein
VRHCAQAHISSNLLTVGNHCNADNRRNLVKGLLVFSLMLSAQVQHLLNLENVAGARVGATVNDQFDEVCEFLVLNEVADLHCRLGLRLLTEEE